MVKNLEILFILMQTLKNQSLYFQFLKFPFFNYWLLVEKFLFSYSERKKTFHFKYNEKIQS